MNKVIQFPTGIQRKKLQEQAAKQPKQTREERYMKMLEQTSNHLFETAERFGIDIKDLMSDLNYVVIVTDFTMGEGEG